MKSIALIFVAFLAISCTFFAPAQAQNCELCETVITLVETWVEANATEQEIIQYLNTICALFPQYQQTCDQIADQGVGQVIQWIEQNETPTQVCTQLGFCTSSKGVSMPSPKTALRIAKLLPQPPKPKVNDDAECDVCEEVIGYIENWLANSDDQEQVITAVEVVCTYMPEWENTCDAIIAAGVPEVINWILTYENNTVVCGQLGLCDAVVPQAEAPKLPADSCDDCTTVIGYIESWVAANATESEIVTYLETICTLLPQYQQICSSIIATEIPAIIADLEANQPPATICAEIGLCSGQKSLIHPSSVKIN
jgi:saposin